MKQKLLLVKSENFKVLIENSEKVGNELHSNISTFNGKSNGLQTKINNIKEIIEKSRLQEVENGVDNSAKCVKEALKLINFQWDELNEEIGPDPLRKNTETTNKFDLEYKEITQNHSLIVNNDCQDLHFQSRYDNSRLLSNPISNLQNDLNSYNLPPNVRPRDNFENNPSIHNTKTVLQRPQEGSQQPIYGTMLESYSQESYLHERNSNNAGKNSIGGPLPYQNGPPILPNSNEPKFNPNNQHNNLVQRNTQQPEKQIYIHQQGNTFISPFATNPFLNEKEVVEQIAQPPCEIDFKKQSSITGGPPQFNIGGPEMHNKLAFGKTGPLISNFVGSGLPQTPIQFQELQKQQLAKDIITEPIINPLKTPNIPQQSEIKNFFQPNIPQLSRQIPNEQLMPKSGPSNLPINNEGFGLQINSNQSTVGLNSANAILPSDIKFNPSPPPSSRFPAPGLVRPNLLMPNSNFPVINNLKPIEPNLPKQNLPPFPLGQGGQPPINPKLSSFPPMFPSQIGMNLPASKLSTIPKSFEPRQIVKATGPSEIEKSNLQDMNNFSIFTNPVPSINSDPYSEERAKTELVMIIKQKNQEILIFDLNIITVIKLTKSVFENQSKAFQSFPENCRFTNCGNSLFVCGGLVNKQATTLAFSVHAQKCNNSYSITIKNHPSMIEARDRHCVLYLENKNSIVACTGFYKNSAEILNLDGSNWATLPQLKEQRANSTIGYINNRFIYMFGGYKLNVENKKEGTYHNNSECLDMDNLKDGWKFIDFSSMSWKSVKLCAMGIITLNQNKILLCGGFDGTKNTSLINQATFNLETGEILSFNEDLTFKLPTTHIFLSNNFIKIGSKDVNFDSNSFTAVSFDQGQSSFDLVKS